MHTPMPLLMQATAVPATFSPPASFQEAYRDHAQTVARWARQLGGSDIDVEDVVQDVFLVVSRRLAGFRGEARFSSWLFEITRKTVANHRRRQRWRFWCLRIFLIPRLSWSGGKRSRASIAPSTYCRRSTVRCWCCTKSKACRRRPSPTFASSTCPP